MNALISDQRKEFLFYLKVPQLELGTHKICGATLAYTSEEKEYTFKSELVLEVVKDQNLGEINQDVEEIHQKALAFKTAQEYMKLRY